MKNRFYWEVRPLARPSNVFKGDNFRFTVLTPYLIRLEYSPVGKFEDRASQVAFYRDFPKCEFKTIWKDGILQLNTEALELTYNTLLPFSENSLSLRLKIEPASVWHYGEDFEDLGGTARTLDEVNGACSVDRGVCSRNGYSVLDDSDSLLLEDDGWIGLRNEGNIDCYFFGYGYDYLGAVKDLYRLTGEPPMLPAYALGNWWSRYYNYSQQEYLDLMDRFRRENIPFSVGVVDMDWHVTEIPEELRDPDPRIGRGWTGYSWNKTLFPDYKAFLKELHNKNLKTALNLHPAVGTCCHEEMYQQMAVANGIDPSSKQRVPLDILSQKHMETYFDILHHPYEKDGVDFWWMDWQQGTSYWWIHEANKPGQYQDPREKMDPLWMLNHLHIIDISRNGKRPMFFSRYAGPGSHRYPVGFSGDTVISWESLKFQPEFTAMASNVGYSWWSHDIGGHMHGYQDNELFVRWVQSGVFSPINRLHSTKRPFMHKEPWNYPAEIADILGLWLRLRHTMFPYLYTMNYRNHVKLEPLVQPMYYSHPKCHEAYRCGTQFWFGSELMVSPIVEPNDRESGLGRADVWLPKGNWFDMFNGMHYASKRGRRMEVFRPLDRMPVFAKAGAIVPMANYPHQDNRLYNSQSMQVLVFPGADNTFVLYEDVGEGSEFKEGAFAETKMQLHWGDTAYFVIHPAKGDLSLIPQKRTWKIGLRGFHKDISVSGGTVVWDKESNTAWITVEASVETPIKITIDGKRLIHDNSDRMQRCEAIIRNCQLTYANKESLWNKINKDYRNLRQRNSSICGNEPKVARALMELFTLTEDIYLGNQV